MNLEVSTPDGHVQLYYRDGPVTFLVFIENGTEQGGFEAWLKLGNRYALELRAITGQVREAD